MIRVAFDMTTRAPEGSGIAVIARNLADALADRPELDLVRLYPPAGPMSTPRRVWWDQVGGPAEARRRGAHVLHRPGFCASRFPGMPQVLTLHDLAALHYPEEATTASARFYWRRLLPRSVSWATRVVCGSVAARDDALRRLPGLRRRPEVAYWALPARRARPAGPAEVDAVTARHALTPGRYFLVVGSALPRKDQPLAVQAFGALAGEPAAAGVSLAIAGGGGPDHARLEAALGRVEAVAPGRARRLGWVPDGDLPALYAGALALLFPSRLEGFGIPPLEAMAQGTPVVAADASSLPEVVGDAGLLFAPGDRAALAAAMRRVVTEPGLRDRLARRGRRRAARFTWERCAAAYAAVYRGLVGGG